MSAAQKIMQQGMQKGRQEEKLQVAKSMLKEGLAVQVIQKVTGLSQEELAGI
jgi:predicted transposase/invertase (TIGR01784 family)